MPVTRAARTRRAKELEAAADPAALVLELLLQHAQPQQAWVCALLRCSKATADALAERLAGTLCVKAAPRSVADALGLSFWVRRHGRLLAELEFKPAVPDDAVADAGAAAPSSGNDAAGLLLASSLSEAAGGLQQLRAFTCRTPDAAPDLLLLSLPDCSALTRLDIALAPVRRAVEPEELVLHALYASMACLTGLRELRLETRHFYGLYEDAAAWTPALSVLTALTSLQLSGPYLGEADGVQPITIDSLPPSLRRFEAHTCCAGIYMSRPLLTELIFDGSINERDELPPTLVRLECGGLASLKPLQRLHSLKSVRAYMMSDAYKAELAARGVTVE